MAISVAICAGSHLIPSISKTKLAWLLWVLCMVGAVYSHITFFSFAKLRANDDRSQYSIQRSGVEREIEATRSALARIEARPVATVASELAVTKGWSRRNALEEELSEARRASVLQAEMIKLASKATVIEVTGSEDIVTSRIAKVTGGNQDSIELVIALIFSILIELLGAFLWREILMRKDEIPAYESPEYESLITTEANKHVDLDKAIATGIVKPTVKGIRTFLGCSQSKAMEFRRTYNLQNNEIIRNLPIFLVVASSLMGCSTNTNKIIEQQEDEAKRSHSVFKVQNPDYHIVLDKNNKVTQICNVASRAQCNYPRVKSNEIVQVSS